MTKQNVGVVSFLMILGSPNYQFARLPWVKFFNEVATHS